MLALSPLVIPWTNRLLTYSDICHGFYGPEKMLVIGSDPGHDADIC